VERPNPNGAEDAIDAVVAWVDVRDPKHRAKRNGIWPILAAMVRLSGWQARSDASCPTT
jgi:hypothetical protein